MDLHLAGGPIVISPDAEGKADDDQNAAELEPEQWVRVSRLDKVIDACRESYQQEDGSDTYGSAKSSSGRLHAKRYLLSVICRLSDFTFGDRHPVGL